MKDALPLKILVLTSIIILAVIVGKVLYSIHETQTEAVFDFWFAVGDERSDTRVTRRNEEIDGKTLSVVTITGTLQDYDTTFAGVYGRPDATTLNILRTMKSISFTVLGDGNRYSISLPTFETIELLTPQVHIGKDNIVGDHWMNIFSTTRGESTVITVNIPKDLIRICANDTEFEFLLKNTLFVQIQPVDPGDYQLKFWDIRLSH